MGLLDDLAGQVLGGGTAKSNLMNEVMGMLNNQQSGGLSGLIQQFSGKGLGDIISSWVGTGQNLPITPQQIQQVLGSDTVKQLAAKAGLSNNEVTSHLSELLPQVVDRLTPNGKVPSGDLMSKGMDILKVLLR
jgi:uncharacterized protein YidB (DUF937 family)